MGGRVGDPCVSCGLEPWEAFPMTSAVGVPGRCRLWARSLIAACVLGVIGCSSTSLADSREESRIADRLVLIATRSLGSNAIGNGFVIGDGSLVVTALHVAAERMPGRGAFADGLVTVISPYLGDACEPELIVVDKELDLAILRTRWVGHPALRLGGAEALLRTGSVSFASLFDQVDAIRRADVTALDKPLRARTDELPVDFIAVRGSIKVPSDHGSRQRHRGVEWMPDPSAREP